jgi:hypothetical protein
MSHQRLALKCDLGANGYARTKLAGVPFATHYSCIRFLSAPNRRD